MTTLELIHGLYDYHRWANRRLFDDAQKRGDEAVERDMGAPWSFPCVRRMFAHIYGADAIWLARWKGTSMSALRERWDALETEQRAFVDGLGAADLARIVEYKNTEGKAFRTMLAPLLQHVPNHATHHRSEIATMLTIVSGSPPDTGLATFLWTTGRTS